MRLQAITVILLAAGTVACNGQPEVPAETAAEEQTAAATPDIGALLDAAVAGEHRPEDARARDRYRHPKETLMFFGLRPDMTVVEMYPGTGWYSAILAPVLRENGHLVAAQFDPETPPDYRAGVYADYMMNFAEFPGVYDEVEVIIINPPDAVTLGEDGSADMVVTFRNIHSWTNAGEIDAVFGAIARVLKPGGIFGVVQHRADEGVDPIESAKLGYVPESFVIDKAAAAGLVLVDRSEINANPKDTKDHMVGVWALPPSLRGDLNLREEKRAIGESDRMTLKFVKPTS